VIKAGCHVHSEWSYDGKWPLSKLVTQFGTRGYRVLLTTEHDRGWDQRRLDEYRHACAQASSDQVLLVPGIEYSDPDNVVHILVWGNVPFLGEGLATEHVLREVKAAHGIAVLAHPSRREAWKLFQESWCDALLGIEVWNRKSDGWAPGRHAIPLLRRTSLRPFVGLDFHTARQFFPLATELEIESPVSEEAVLACVADQRFRSTAFGLPVSYSGVDGWQATAFSAAERCRRSLAGVRRLFATA
jgi:hypothetical protein